MTCVSVSALWSINWMVHGEVNYENSNACQTSERYARPWVTFSALKQQLNNENCAK